MPGVESETAALILRAASQVVDAIHHGMERRGYGDLRPAHGYAFARISAGDATVVDLAEHLGVTKQAASQLVDQLVRGGYVSRRADPRDARARLLSLTARGRACTRAAEAAMTDAIAAWEPVIGAAGIAAVHAALLPVAASGPLRPTW